MSYCSLWFFSQFKMTMPQAILNSSKKVVQGKLCSKQANKLFLDALNTHKLQDSSLTLVSGNFIVI